MELVSFIEIDKTLMRPTATFSDLYLDFHLLNKFFKQILALFSTFHIFSFYFLHLFKKLQCLVSFLNFSFFFNLSLIFLKHSKNISPHFLNIVERYCKWGTDLRDSNCGVCLRSRVWGHSTLNELLHRKNTPSSLLKVPPKSPLQPEVEFYSI